MSTFTEGVASVWIPEATAPREAQPIPTDLSKRLREFNDSRLFREADVLMLEAADEIDRLAALAAKGLS